MQTTKVTSGQCVFINSEQLHSIYALDDKTSIHHAIVFDLDILNSSIYDYYQNKYIDPILKKSLHFPFCIDLNSTCGNEILEIIDTYHKKSTGYELSIKGSLLKIIANLYEEDKLIGSTVLIPKYYKVQIIKKVFDFINNNYTHSIFL